MLLHKSHVLKLPLLQYIGKSDRDAKKVAKRAEKWDLVHEAFNAAQRADGKRQFTLQKVCNQSFLKSTPFPYSN